MTLTRQIVDPKERIFIALDTDSIDEAIRMVRMFHPHVGGFKMGSELIESMDAMTSPPLVQLFEAEVNVAKKFELYEAMRGKKVMRDLKYSDIPKTVVGAVEAACRLRPYMLTVHASAGQGAMTRAVAASRAYGADRPLVIAVTLLTSIDKNLCEEMYNGHTVREQVLYHARQALAAGCDGITCSPNELDLFLARDDFYNMIKVVPSIRPSGAADEDQKRPGTFSFALTQGADYVVVGSAVTGAADPVAAVRNLAAEARTPMIAKVMSETFMHADNAL